MNKVLFWLQNEVVTFNHARLKKRRRVMILVEDINELFSIFHTGIETLGMWTFASCLADLTVIVKLVV